jgi:hypothetical protein
MLAVMPKRFDPAARGLHVLYRPNEVNHCPGCGRTHWLIGRVTAECAFCATAVPLEEQRTASHATIIHHKRAIGPKR